MQLTAFTDYTLRTLIYLGIEEGRRATVAEIAAAYGIAENHLTKVVLLLGQAGDVATLRGRGGGLRLARPASAINVGAVVRRTEPGLALAPCLGTGNCVITPACCLRPVLAEALDAFLGVLDRYTLADLVAGSRGGLARLLGLTLPAA
ncbi:MAG: Rrf2 family transcriptional regulator [Alphaproteobacteria bacterium]|nr:Rrf2 family transcriptional regulator [Alphaproteobacteria bacterium]